VRTISEAYQRRQPEKTVLYRVINEHLATFLGQAKQEGKTIPKFVRKDIQGILDCGILAKGFVRVVCKDCKTEHLVALSCKGATCPSCCGRRMTQRAAFLVDHVIPKVSIRQWVLSLPIRMRYLLAYNEKLCSKVLSIANREIFRWYRFKAKAELDLDSVSQAECGSVTVIQRFDSGLRCNVHFHLIVMDGVWFKKQSEEKPVFFGMPAPTNKEIIQVALGVRKKVMKLFEKEGIDFETGYPTDPIAEEEPFLAQLSQASTLNMTAIGPHAGQPTGRLYDAEIPIEQTSTRCVNVDGFSMHANIRIKAGERKRLEKMCRYISRGPIATERLTELPDGHIAYAFKRPWSDGSRAVVFKPLEFIGRLLPLVPPPRVNMIRYFGVLAPNAHSRPDVVRLVPKVDDKKDRPKNYCWAILMERAFDFEVLVCPKCKGTMRVIATIRDREVIKKILSAVGYPTDSPQPAPARPVVQESFDFDNAPSPDDDSYCEAA